MNLDKLLETGDRCIHKEPPPCTAQCPIHLEVIDFLSEIEKGNFQNAYKLMEKKMPFHKIIGRICDHPCEAPCERSKAGGSIRISDLEKAVLEYGGYKPKKVWPLPKNKGKVAIVGGGLSGLTAAVDLDKKGYIVTIFEKTNRLGGRLWDFVGNSLTEALLNQELKAVVDKKIAIHLENNVDQNKLTQLLTEYDAVYLGTSNWEEPIKYHPITFQVGDFSLFVGGQLVSQTDSVIFSASSGRRAAISIERYLSKVSLTDSRDREGVFETPLQFDISSKEPLSPIAKSTAIYSQEEAMEEAKRCVKCQCRKCIEGCVHLRKFDISPDAYIRQINHNERIILGTHYANKMINSCAECGLCKEACFLDISMNDVIHETRESMVERGKMPITAHDFALKDMAFSNSSRFSLVRKQPSKEESKDLFYYPLISFSDYVKGLYKGTGNTEYLFYPGCQLPASYPDDIKSIYEYLVGHVNGDVGIYLGCCGAPADWAGQQGLMSENIEAIKKVWVDLERPTFILACSSCMRIFKKYLPEIKVVSLWDIYVREGLPNKDHIKIPQTLSVHDACGTRENSDLHESVRKIVSKLGYGIKELEYTKEKTKCCGYGGLVYYANREQSDAFVHERIGESENDLLVYCAMCKDLFVSGGKRTYHLLDLIYPKDDGDAATRKMPTLSERHQNRSRVKQILLKEIWREEPIEDIMEDNLTLIIPEEVKKNIEDRYILMEDIQAVLKNAEAKNERFCNPETHEYLAKLRRDSVTFWVKYQKDEKNYLIKSIYSHRMEIVEEDGNSGYGNSGGGWK
ncbi:pyridine nucleotide-disulfide oxidoreductase/dicluster-binding protein [Acetobacterium sp. KB-1]|uniref:pyridine nucleotide-disulfide oxidoreductase/dicluster-binding protein n=1 Tax=Acetobacterium sp. KB-1 TaxID=2184575 RepID=UPI000DBEBC55|nr:pyridine nucleotide-disulfide oxidoreductase/dicluster-binding protein [Acetobacterium sp. KB-1]AWW25234.1 pyridine nucleotide-disulfide oxidoreductase [Acetobacterium sp. KB-1]